MATKQKSNAQVNEESQVWESYKSLQVPMDTVMGAWMLTFSEAYGY